MARKKCTAHFAKTGSERICQELISAKILADANEYQYRSKVAEILTRLATIILATTALLTGSLIYILWRKKSLLMFSWFSTMGLDSFIDKLRFYAIPYEHVLPSWVYLSLPEALWLLSGILYFYALWWKGSALNRMLWTSLFVIIAIGSEIGQGIKIIPGCFDVVDLALMLTVSAPICFAFVFKFRKKGGIAQ